MNAVMGSVEYKTKLPSASHWSLRVRRGMQMTLTDLKGGANVGMLFFNPENLLERYNAPDTLKCQHTFKLTQGHCLYSDMGRIFASIIEDSLGWHETVAGNSHASHVEKLWGARDYQTNRNSWKQNGYDSFLVEMAKYGLQAPDMAANLNLFSKVSVDEQGKLALAEGHSAPGSHITLRFEMDTLVILHTCPHPLNTSAEYPRHSVQIELAQAAPMNDTDVCLNHCAENRRGFENNRLYHMGM